MPSTVTTPIAARIPNEQAAALREQAERSGITLSKAAGVAIARGLAGEQGAIRTQLQVQR